MLRIHELIKTAEEMIMIIFVISNEEKYKRCEKLSSLALTQHSS